MSQTDPYWMLRPVHTPQDEICSCSSVTRLILRECITPNPITCASCFCEVDPQKIGLPVDLVQPIAQWRELHHSLWTLWLDSGPYEEWATERLCDPHGAVNTRGADLCRELSRVCLPTLHWWFVPDPDLPRTECPLCHGSLDEWPTRPVFECHTCGILT